MGRKRLVSLGRSNASSKTRLSIVDDGPGVATIEIARLGERTFRTDAARARDLPGSGLGLGIRRDVCEKAGFTLTSDRATEGAGSS